MRQISLKLTDEEYKKMESLRGSKTITEYFKMLLSSHDETITNESVAFQRLFSDVALIRDTVRGIPKQKDLLALATFMTEVSSIANTPAYANHQDKIQQLYQTLTSQIQTGE